ncbi:MAG TPA: ATP-binding protein [Thermoleophilaceae bacterium]|jgi:hypothetical protein
MLKLAELARERKELRDAVKLHEQSLEQFWPRNHEWFGLDQSERKSPPSDRPDGRPRHLSTSASCYESLADQNLAGAGLPHRWVSHAAAFSIRALEAPAEAWRSEGAAEVYCRVRTLPAVLRFAERLDGELGTAAAKLLEEAWSSVLIDAPAQAGLAERGLYKDDGGRIGGPPEDRSPGYPPNAFLTYWGLRALEAYRQRRAVATLPPVTADLDVRVRLAKAWATQMLARQTALILGGAERTDAQQLAFALTTDLRWGEGGLTAGNARHELYSAALEAFFAKQLTSGGWPRSEPLFHYPKSGNAYCFTYETLTELLRPALPREGGRVFRELLRPHLHCLLRAWHHARQTQVPLDDDGAAYGWSSGHHVFRQQPEAWATASVYSFAQMLRCVVGHFAVDAASDEVRIRRPRKSDPTEARRELRQRGRTWATDGWTVGRQLASLFLHPRSAPGADPEMRDPDTPLIAEEDARSAILFGPPGTGKTTLVESLAGALGWRFVEIQAADFLSDGVDAVPARADDIFGALMELDRCVVLFDEIDELIRRREGLETDPFGRFLTTSMLPKIAQLWDQRKILFFVATNHVANADPAIRRSSRFDAAILVAPPSLAAKREELERQLGESPPEIAADKVVESLLPAAEQLHVAPADLPLGVLALLRHDQISELADRLKAQERGEWANQLPEILAVMGDDLLRNEWRSDEQEPPEDRNERLRKLYDVLRHYQAEERKDRSRRRYLLAPSAGERPVGSVAVREVDSMCVCVTTVEGISSLAPDGAGHLRAPSSQDTQLIDDGLLKFSTT